MCKSCMSNYGQILEYYQQSQEEAGMTVCEIAQGEAQYTKISSLAYHCAEVEKDKPLCYSQHKVQRASYTKLRIALCVLMAAFYL